MTLSIANLTQLKIILQPNLLFSSSFFECRDNWLVSVDGGGGCDLKLHRSILYTHTRTQKCNAILAIFRVNGIGLGLVGKEKNGNE